jgi:hypothetical protein
MMWNQKTTELGKTKPNPLFNSGDLYTKNCSKSPYQSEAFRWNEKATELGNAKTMLYCGNGFKAEIQDQQQHLEE